MHPFHYAKTPFPMLVTEHNLALTPTLPHRGCAIVHPMLPYHRGYIAPRHPSPSTIMKAAKLLLATLGHSPSAASPSPTQPSLPAAERNAFTLRPAPPQLSPRAGGPLAIAAHALMRQEPTPNRADHTITIEHTQRTIKPANSARAAAALHAALAAGPQPKRHSPIKTEIVTLTRNQAISLVMAEQADHVHDDPFSLSEDWARAELTRIRRETEGHSPRTELIPGYSLSDGKIIYDQHQWKLVQVQEPTK